jgi:RNA polymerase sigma-70 factor (ECF subfamily)
MSTAAEPVELELDTYRRELTGYCYRMLGSGFEAEDAVQETMVRAWKAYDRFEGRSALRSWLYRIATNVCLDMQKGPQRRARPMDLGPSSTAELKHLGAPAHESTWVQPMPDARVLPEGGDPAEVAAARESIRLAFVAALQYLPARQRAVLILREVLRWPATEVAELLETSVASVNSALQRARATLAERQPTEGGSDPVDPEHQALLARYVDAFERYDMDAMVQLLHDDAVISMPPYPLWIRGPEEIIRWFVGPGHQCKGSRLVATSANGSAAFGSYRQSRPGLHEPWSLQLIDVADGKISGQHNFLVLGSPDLFSFFGLPPRLES